MKERTFFLPLLLAIALFSTWSTLLAADPPTDEQIQRKASEVVAALIDDPDAPVEVVADAGVLFVTGRAAVEPDLIKSALKKLEGVVAVVVEVEHFMPATESIEPAVNRLEQMGITYINYLPLLGVAIGVLILFWLLAKAVNWFDPILRRSFPAESVRHVIKQALRLIVMLIGFVFALEILNATALVGGVLGAAGVAGIAIGFAFRDLIENYIASVMLGLRQPFRPGDFVRISKDEGIVARLSSRSTILMTLDGNRLRIPNSDVFKSTILNYTTTPKRRFSFSLGIGYEVDPDEAIQLGVRTLKLLEGVAQEPGPFGRAVELGDSTVKLSFFAWVDQNIYDYGLIRSKSLTIIKKVFDEHNLEMPEPIFNLRMINQQSAGAGKPAPPSRQPESMPVSIAADDAGESGMQFARQEAAKEAAAGDNSLQEKPLKDLD